MQRASLQKKWDPAVFEGKHCHAETMSAYVKFHAASKLKAQQQASLGVLTLAYPCCHEDAGPAPRSQTSIQAGQEAEREECAKERPTAVSPDPFPSSPRPLGPRHRDLSTFP